MGKFDEKIRTNEKRIHLIWTGATVGDTCRICSHPHRSTIDAWLKDGRWPLDDIAARFGVSRSSLHRHNHTHVWGHSQVARARMRPRRRAWVKWVLLGGAGLLGVRILAAVKGRP